MNIDTIYIEITNICNLNCTTCYNTSGINTERCELSLVQLKNIISTFKAFGLKRIIISGGEPMLHSEIDSILAFIASSDLNFEIITNATIHNPKLIYTLNTSDNLTLQISLDGSSEEQNCKTRGKGNFDKTISFINKLSAKRTYLLKMVISQNNLDDIEDFYKLAFSVGFTPEFAFIYKSGNGITDWDTKSLSAQQKIKVINLIKNLNEELSLEAFLPLCTTSCNYANGLNNLSLCIKSNGAMQPCQTLYDDNFTLGNILDFNKDELVGKTNKMGELANQRKSTNYGCDKCMINDICEHGCMAAAIHSCGDPLGDDGDCQFRKAQFVEYNLKGVVRYDYRC